ncbi:mechanosensitive ion channel family protein [Indiicoccus explosivorum]|uniref:mechanosensitive ion channel family protein n=1 Tax=Indiicoccus explosivorum TaxID=1917864 RepID=UPI0030C74A57
MSEVAEKAAETAKAETEETLNLIADIRELLVSEDTWIFLGIIALKVLLIVLISVIAVKILRTIVRRVLAIQLKGPLHTTDRRQRTLVKLLENVVAYVVYFAAILAILSTFQVDTAGLLAGAGVVGLAVGFGAQSLVKDIITGFFIIFEDQFSVGDFVRAGTAEGTVEEIGLRTTKIKAFTGELFILPNGSIVDITNFSVNNSIAVVDISIAYESDIAKAEKLIQGFLENLPENYDKVVKPPELLGVQMLGASEVVLRVTAETLPMEHFAVSRNLRRDLKIFLDSHGIEIPYPRMVTIQRSPEDSESPKEQQEEE